MKFEPVVSEMIQQLETHHENLLQRTKDLAIQHQGEVREVGRVIYRFFTTRNEKTRLRVDWQKVQFSGGTSRVTSMTRIPLGQKYQQSVRFMGSMDTAHIELFNRFDPHLAKIREMADLNADMLLLARKYQKRLSAMDE
jgi:hypothetical protein